MFMSNFVKLWVINPVSLLLQYLKQGSIKDKSLDDAADYRRMDDSMNKVGFSEEEKANIFKVVTAVLHVGNIAFEESGDKDGKCQKLIFG